MQYQVPQFIETEDKIIGGVLTLKQFLIIAAAAGVSFLFYFLFEIFTWVLTTTFIGIIALGIAFVKIQGRSVPTIIVAAFRYYWNPRFYLWRSETIESEAVALDIKTTAQKNETPKQFIFHRKEARQKIPTLNKNEVRVPTAGGVEKVTEPKIETVPLTWQKTAPAEPHRQNFGVVPEPSTEKISPRAHEEKLLKKEELLEREVAKLENAKVRLESEMRKLAQKKDMVTSGVARVKGALPKTREMPRVPETLLGLRHKLATAGGKVQNLFEKLSTSKTSLPKRERKFIDLGKNSKEKLELLRKATGEVELARRVDYSDSSHP